MKFEYPFERKWVVASAILSGLSMFFGLAILSKESSWILMYLSFVFCLTLIVLPLKYYFYLKKEQELESEYIPESEEEKSKSYMDIIILFCLAMIAICFPFILTLFLDPLWWIIAISGSVPGICLPEIILYVYSKTAEN